ncbi:hypothetical protein [Daejeonella lutea]|uniref:Uncharacterized protein n=1 Tax=Daejeonella lutea TaxID=572036 RepID=A0A1T5ANC0_9SPHI|nr:hypothetical protein [Daejeonella lutea]SKB36478.1 hypothetical protein SAMN05661099_0892 [Daejeonella lutea]
MRFQRLLTLILFLFFTACGKSAEERKLEQMAVDLESREKLLLAREQQVDLKELELAKLQQQIDSIRGKSDTIGTYNPELVGTWQVTMNCIETTCEGSAVGDTKTEQWIISYQNNKVIARAQANANVIRVYNGLYKENALQLAALETPDQETHMDVLLTPHATTKGLMEGQRIINRLGICRTVYTLKAEKQ